LLSFIATGCSKQSIESKYTQTIPQTEYTPEPEPELAYVSTSTINFKINNYPLSENERKTILIGINNVSFNGLVKLTITSDPIVDVNKEQANAAKFTACISALPLCPLTLLLMQIAFEENSIVDATCNGELNFYALNNKSYFLKLETTEDINPKILVISSSDNAKVAERTTECDVTNTIDKYRQEN